MNMNVEPDSGAAEPCLIDKLVSINGGRSVGRVVRRSEQFTERYLVSIFEQGADTKILLNGSDLEVIILPSPPLFAHGSYARATHGIVYILDGGDTDGYWVTYTQHEKEFFTRVDGLTPWVPAIGEAVCENADDDESVDKTKGVVVEVWNGASLVRWPGDRDETWLNADLEPAWD
jgi:hypothetical protein